MTANAPWLMALSVDAPLVGAVIGLILITGRVPWPRAAVMAANLGIAGSCISAIALAVVLGSQSGSQSMAHRIGTWLQLSGSRHVQIDWGLTADLPAAIWIAVLSGVAWVNVVVNRPESGDGNSPAFSIASGLVVASTIGFVLSTGLVQMLTCWTAISLSTLMLVGWTSTQGVSIQGMRRAVQAGLPGDILLLWSILLIGRVSGSDSFAAVLSPTGLVRLGAGNPAFPGLIGCVLVLSALGRCGLFPCFGWNQGAAHWDARICTVVYGIAYVPSALWMLLKFQPLLTSDVSASLLGGVGALGAVLGAFVACGQDDPRRRLGYLLTAQTGILMTSLGSGLSAAVPLCAWRQCWLSMGALVLLIACRSTGRFSRLAVWCAALSMAGLFPFSGSWSQQGLVELNAQQVSVASPLDIDNSPDTTVDGSQLQDDRPPEVPSNVREPRWEWMVGIWVAQGLSAFAVVKIACQGLPAQRTRVGLLASIALQLGIVLLLIGGPCAWWWGIVSLPTTLDPTIRFAIGQGIALFGLFAGWQVDRRSLSQSPRGWEAISRLSRQRLYVDQIVERMMEGPNWLIQQLSRQPGSVAVERAWSWMFVRSAAWLGLQFESLQVGRVDFYVASILLGTVTLLLTLILAA